MRSFPREKGTTEVRVSHRSPAFRFPFFMPPHLLQLAAARAPSAVHGMAWLPDPHAAGAHVAGVGGTPTGRGCVQV